MGRRSHGAACRAAAYQGNRAVGAVSQVQAVMAGLVGREFKSNNEAD